MLKIDTILALYPDDASRQLLLSQALAQTRTDLAALRRALATGDRNAALAHTHQAKGTISFLGGDTQALQGFDHLTRALQKTHHLAPQCVREARPGVIVDNERPPTTVRSSIAEQRAASATMDAASGANMASADIAARKQVDAAFTAVESILQDMEIALLAAIDGRHKR